MYSCFGKYKCIYGRALAVGIQLNGGGYNQENRTIKLEHERQRGGFQDVRAKREKMKYLPTCIPLCKG